jgi:hypothetical protein
MCLGVSSKVPRVCARLLSKYSKLDEDDTAGDAFDAALDWLCKCTSAPKQPPRGNQRSNGGYSTPVSACKIAKLVQSRVHPILAAVQVAAGVVQPPQRPVGSLNQSLHHTGGCWPLGRPQPPPHAADPLRACA